MQKNKTKKFGILFFLEMMKGTIFNGIFFFSYTGL